MLLINYPLHLYSCNNDPLHAAGSPRKANRPSPTKGIPCILWNQKVHYHVHNNPTNGAYPEPDKSGPHLPI